MSWLLTMTIRACSLMLNRPGLMSKENLPKGRHHRGSFSHALPVRQSEVSIYRFGNNFLKTNG
jgi:hypothetical protein